MEILCRAIFFFLLLSFIPASASAQDGESLHPFAEKKGNLVLEGGTSHIPIMNELAKRIMDFNPAINISVGGGGSSIGIKKVGEGSIDLGNSGRPLKEEEKLRYKLTSIPFAIDGIAPVVHRSNPVAALPSEMIRKIFAGEILNWKMVGGGDSPIKLFGRDQNSATRAIFWEKMLHKGKISKKTTFVESNNSMKVIVSWDKSAIGYMSIGVIDPEKIKALEVDGVIPSQENAKNGKYPVVRRLFVNMGQQPSELARLFVDYLKSPEGQEVIRSFGYIAIK